VGPAIEAFGFERILFGSSPSSSARSAKDTNANDWYELARESFAELGVDQEAIDTVFGATTRRLYESPQSAT
jgi:predicted TIM-barrel fold metal-dependent hydrolase